MDPAKRSRAAEARDPATKPAGPAFAKLYLKGLADDRSLTSPEKLVLTCLLNHQRMHGGGWFVLGYADLGRELGKHPKDASRLVRQLNAKEGRGETEWKVLKRYRRFGRVQKKNAMRVRVPDGVRDEWRAAAGLAPLPGAAAAAEEFAAGPVTYGGPTVAKPATPGARALPIKEDLRKNSLKEGCGENRDNLARGRRGESENEGASLFDDEPARVNPFALRGREGPGGAGGGGLVDRLAAGVEAGDVAFVLWGGAWRVLLGVRWSDATRGGVDLVLASEAEPDAAEWATVAAGELGGLRFGR